MPLTPSHAPARDTSADLSRAAILIFAIACGVCVANVYFPQALSPLIARSLHAAPATAALLVTATQLGYAAGLYLLVPLGDRVRPRLLIVTLIILTAAGLVGAGTAPTLAVLLVAGTAVGVTTVVPQILLPMAAGLVPDQRRGAVTGTLLSGLLGGILLARTFSGALGGWLDWRAPYLVAAVLMVILAFVLARVLPVTSPPNREHYGALLAAPVRLLRAEPDLRRSCVYQALMFGTFSAAWTAIALLLTGPSYGLSTQAVGVFALIGAGAVLVTPVAGRRIDRVGPDRISLVSFTGGLGSAAILALAALPALHGRGQPDPARRRDAAAGRGGAVRAGRQPGPDLRAARGRPGAPEHGLHDLHVPGRQRGLVAGRAGLQRVRLGRHRRAHRARVGRGADPSPGAPAVRRPDGRSPPGPGRQPDGGGTGGERGRDGSCGPGQLPVSRSLRPWGWSINSEAWALVRWSGTFSPASRASVPR